MTLSLVPCGPQYYEFVRYLRTHDENISGFADQRPIKFEDHVRYMDTVAKGCYWICLLDEAAGFMGCKAVGYCAVVAGDVKICTHPQYKKKGIGKFMLTSLAILYPDAAAQVFDTNKSSLALFRSCGWTETDFDGTWHHFRINHG